MATPKIHRYLSAKLWDKGAFFLLGFILSGALIWFSLAIRNSRPLAMLGIGGIMVLAYFSINAVIFRVLKKESILCWPVCIFGDLWLLTGLLGILGIF
jgi:hypothetical protein